MLLDSGYKTNTSCGELLKEQEEPIGRAVERVRQALYNQPFSSSSFDADGRFKSGHAELPAPVDDARAAYAQRYSGFFAGQSLNGMRLLFYQHSAVGRDCRTQHPAPTRGRGDILTGRSDGLFPSIRRTLMLHS